MARAFWTRRALTRPDLRLGCPKPCTGPGVCGPPESDRVPAPRPLFLCSIPIQMRVRHGRQPCSGPRDHNVAILPSRSNASVGRGLGRVAQPVRAFRLHRRGRGFESLSAHSVAICPGWSWPLGLDAVDQCRGQRPRTPSSKVAGRNMHVGRTGRCLSQVAGTGTIIKYCDFPGPSCLRGSGPVIAHRNRLHAIDPLGFGMDSRRLTCTG